MNLEVGHRFELQRALQWIADGTLAPTDKPSTEKILILVPAESPS